MAKRKPRIMDTLALATQAKGATQTPAPVMEKLEMATSAVNLPKGTWALLRRVAFRRAELYGGRISVSKVISGLVDAHREGLEKELEGD